jgi:uncharacterized protein (TIGR02231 family)
LRQSDEPGALPPGARRRKRLPGQGRLRPATTGPAGQAIASWPSQQLGRSGGPVGSRVAAAGSPAAGAPGGLNHSGGRRHHDEDTAEQARLGCLGHLSEAAATALARAVSFRRAGHDDLAQMPAHLSADTASALGRRREISARRRAAHRELNAAEQRLAVAEKRASHSVAFVEVSATLEASAATGAEVELSYHVSGASWRPLYDLALDGERLAVTYLAEVTQQTGEDWPAVELVLSTTRRGLHQTLPELPPGIPGTPSRSTGQMAAGRSMAFTGAVPQSAPSPMAAAPAGPAPEADLEEAALLAVEPGESGVGLVYRVPSPLAVPAGDEDAAEDGRTQYRGMRGAYGLRGAS